MKYHYLKVSFIPVMAKSFLQSSVSHDPSEILLIYCFVAQNYFYYK